jgi:hypothetical protein
MYTHVYTHQNRLRNPAPIMRLWFARGFLAFVLPQIAKNQQVTAFS